MSKCVVIGTSKIASVHLKALLNNRYKKYFIISRNIKRAKNFILKYKFKEKNVYPADYKILNKNYFKVISICVNTNFHDNCLNLINRSKSLLIVEKPIISLIKFKKDYTKYLDKVYKKHKKLIVCYPMLFLAKSFTKQFKIEKKINSIEVFYNTNGNHRYNEIGTDLLPHAISLIYQLLGKKKIFKKILNVKSIVNSKTWTGYFEMEKIKLKFNFSQNSKKKSEFYFKINKNKITRPTKIINETFTNFIKFKNKKIKINNPMHEFINYSIKNKNNMKWYDENKFLTYEIMRINNLFLNQKN